MAIGGVNAGSYNCNASYPKYLEKRQKDGMILSIMGSGTMASSLLIKNPKIGLGVMIVGLLGALCGIGGAAKATKTLNKYHEPQENKFTDTFVKANAQENKSKGMTDQEAIALLNGLSNPATSGITTIAFADKLRNS